MKPRHRVGWIVAVVGGLCLLLAGYTYLINRPDGGPLVGDEVTSMGRKHIAVGQAHDSYTTNPPSSGPHYAVPEAWGIKSQPILDEHAMHSLEHGTVWITYQPDKLSTDEVRQLEAIAKQYRRTILSPRPQNDSLIAAVSWGRIQKFEQFDIESIRLFAKRNRNHAHERWTLDTPLVIWGAENPQFRPAQWAKSLTDWWDVLLSGQSIG